MDLGGTPLPPFTDKIRKVVFEVAPLYQLWEKSKKTPKNTVFHKSNWIGYGP